MASNAAHGNDNHGHGHQDHPYHLIDPSPWPLLASLGFLFLAGGSAFSFHGHTFGSVSAVAGFLGLLYVSYRWWKDCVKEGIADKAHNSTVRRGLRIGMAMFILSEVMFFFAFFFSFFHSSFLPQDLIEGAWPVAEGHFPPLDTKTISAWSLPLFNTLLLLLSGTTITWAHAALLQNNQRDLIRGLALTVLLGLVFTGVQAYEYYHAFNHYFKFGDNNFSANFYLLTGFHGFHVIIGTLFLIVCLVRAVKGHFTEENHLGFEFAAWYWHFVDVVWLFLFIFVYVWAGWGHEATAAVAH